MRRWTMTSGGSSGVIGVWSPCAVGVCVRGVREDGDGGRCGAAMAEGKGRYDQVCSKAGVCGLAWGWSVGRLLGVGVACRVWVEFLPVGKVAKAGSVVKRGAFRACVAQALPGLDRPAVVQKCRTVAVCVREIMQDRMSVAYVLVQD